MMPKSRHMFKKINSKFFIAVSSLVRKFRQQSREQMEQRRPNLVAALNKIDNFYMELKWDFQSWGKHKNFINVFLL